MKLENIKNPENTDETAEDFIKKNIKLDGQGGNLGEIYEKLKDTYKIEGPEAIEMAAATRSELRRDRAAELLKSTPREQAIEALEKEWGLDHPLNQNQENRLEFRAMVVAAVDMAAEKLKDELNFQPDMINLEKGLADIEEHLMVLKNNELPDEPEARRERVKALAKLGLFLQMADVSNRTQFMEGTEDGKKYKPVLEEYAAKQNLLLDAQNRVIYKSEEEKAQLQEDLKKLGDKLSEMDETIDGAQFAQRRNKIEKLKGQVEGATIIASKVFSEAAAA